MAGMSIYLENQLLGWIKGANFAAAPAATYVALFNGDPTDAGSSGTDVTTTIRPAGRVAATFGAITGQAISNAGAISFGSATAGTNVTHFAIYDAGSGGNMLASAALSGGPQAIATGIIVSFASGALSLSAS